MKQYCETCLVHGQFRRAAWLVTLKNVVSSVQLLEDVPLCENHTEIVDAFVQQTNIPGFTPRLDLQVKRNQP